MGNSYAKFGATIACCAVLMGCQGRGVVGGYVASQDSSAVMLEITSATGADVSGKISAVELHPDGSITAGTKPFNGTIEGDAMRLNVETGGGVSLATAKQTKEGLDLTMYANGGSDRLPLHKGGIDEFQDLSEKLRTKAAGRKQEIQAERARADLIANRSALQRRIDGLTDQVMENAQNVAVKIANLSVAAKWSGWALAKRQELNSANSILDRNSSVGYARSIQVDQTLAKLSQNERNLGASIQDFRQRAIAYQQNARIQASGFQAQCASDTLLSCGRLTTALDLLSERIGEFERKRAASTTVATM